MTATDLIRLAQELAECGGVHRLTSLINAAVHVHLEHEHARIERLESCLRAILAADERGQGLPYAEAMDEAAILVGWHRNPCVRTVEAWEDGPECGVGMSDKVARDLTLEIHDDAQRALRDRPPRYRPQAPSRVPERDVAFGRSDDAPEGRGALVGAPGGLREVKLEPGWLDRQFKTAQEVLDALPPSLREQTPARRNARAMDKCDEHDFRRSNPAPLTSINGERKPLPQSDCQGEYPSGGISHEPDSKIAVRFAGAQSDFGRRLVPRHMPRVNPELDGDGA